MVGAARCLWCLYPSGCLSSETVNVTGTG